MGKQKALIVDDAFFMRNLIKKVLKEKGYEVIGEAKNGKEGITLYFELKPDFVTMDIKMPDISGIEATRQILSKDPNAKIIAVTASDSEVDKEEMLEAGAVEYLKKPFQPAFLTEKIEDMFKAMDVEAPVAPTREVPKSNHVETEDIEENFFETRQIDILSQADETRDRAIVIVNDDERIEFPEDFEKEEKDKYALTEESIFLINKSEDTEIRKQEEVTTLQDEVLDNPRTLDEPIEEVLQPIPKEDDTPPTPVIPKEEPTSYMQIRPPRGKVLSLPSPQHDSEDDEDDEDLIINVSEDEPASERKGMFSWLTSLFKK